MDTTLAPLFNLATKLHQQGNLKEAQVSYLNILKNFKGHSDSLHLLGLTFAQQGNYKEAIKYIRLAIEANAGVAIYHFNLAEAYSRTQQLTQAINAYDHSLQLDKTLAQSYFGKANALKKTGDLNQARTNFQKTIEINPKHSQAYYNWGNTEKELGNNQSALDRYLKCLAINGKHHWAHNNIGIIYQDWNKNKEAISHYKKALAIDLNFKDAHSNLAKIYESQGEVDKSKKYYRNLLAFSPDDVLIDFIIKTINPIVFESKEAIDNYHSTINKAIDQVDSLPFTPDELTSASYNIFSDLIYHGKALRETKEKYAQKFIGRMPKIPVRPTNKIPHIGFVVTNGHEGVFIKCMAGIINQIDKSRFKISIVCSWPNGKNIIKPKLEDPSLVNFVEIPDRFDHAVQTISNARIDILNYWEIGTDTHNYFLPFLRLAPVQCTSWGWPITSGIPTVDYFISAKHLEIAGSDQHYSEKLIRMDRIPVYYYAPPVPEKLKPLEDFGLSSQNNLYFCAQNLKKVHPDFDKLVLEILKKDKQGLVIFIEDKHPSITALLKARLERTCKEVKERIKFVPKMAEQDYLSLLKQVDVALDTLHYGGGANTCYDAFVCGTPVITLPGIYHRSRYAYAAYQQMEMNECIATDKKDYVLKAIELGTDTEKRTRISQNIKEKSELLLTDKVAVNELSDVFEKLL